MYSPAVRAAEIKRQADNGDRSLNMLKNLSIVLFTSLVVLAAPAQEPQPLEDTLLDELVGQWSMKGTLLARHFPHH